MTDDATRRVVTPGAGSAPRRRGRGLVVMVLIVVASLLLPFAAVTV